MDVFNFKYYKIYKNLNRCLGCWPYQKPTEKYIIRFIVLLIFASGFIPEIINLYHVRDDMAKVIDCLPLFLTFTMLIAKYCTWIINEDKMRKLFDMMEHHWKIYVRDDEKIMHKYAETGRRISMLMLVGYYTTALLQILVSLTPFVLDVWYPLNESRPLLFIFETDYLVEREKYFIPIYAHHYVLNMLIISSIIALDGQYGIFSSHACGMFAIVRFCDTMESTYNYLVIVIFGLSIGCISVLGVHILLNFDQPLQEIRYIFICIAHFFHIYYYTWNGQNIFDHSYAIHSAAFNVEWYEDLDESSKLLIMFILRSSKPCLQTAGKVFPLTLTSFTMIVKTSMSFFTMLSNFQ